MEEFIKEKTKMLDDKYCNLFTTYKGLRQDIVQLIKDSNQVEPLVMQKIADFTPEKFLDELDQYNEDMPYHTIGDYEVSNLWTDEQVKWMLNKYYQLKSNFTA